jgi:hypothetical protein
LSDGVTPHKRRLLLIAKAPEGDRTKHARVFWSAALSVEGRHKHEAHE